MENLATLVDTFLTRDRIAQRLCHAYGEDQKGALGYLWARLLPKFGDHVRNPAAWVRQNARGHLLNYLRRECCQRV